MDPWRKATALGGVVRERGAAGDTTARNRVALALAQHEPALPRWGRPIAVAPARREHQAARHRSQIAPAVHEIIHVAAFELVMPLGSVYAGIEA